jgi:nucleotide-binding universal stress UspA family protein
VRFEVADGEPAPTILRTADSAGSDLVVMSSHGRTGVGRLVFGSTTEAVLRETTVPVLVTPGNDAGPEQLEDLPARIGRMLVPVDLTAATKRQVTIARGLAAALNAPMFLLHVRDPFEAHRLPGDGRTVATDRELRALATTGPGPTTRDALVVYGEPADEIARVASERNAGIIVMGLHSSPLLGPHMGSVTYQVLCRAGRLVLALPPVVHDAEDATASPPQESVASS